MKVLDWIKPPAPAGGPTHASLYCSVISLTSTLMLRCLTLAYPCSAFLGCTSGAFVVVGMGVVPSVRPLLCASHAVGYGGLFFMLWVGQREILVRSLGDRYRWGWTWEKKVSEDTDNLYTVCHCRHRQLRLRCLALLPHAPLLSRFVWCRSFKESDRSAGCTSAQNVQCIFWAVMFGESCRL